MLACITMSGTLLLTGCGKSSDTAADIDNKNNSSEVVTEEVTTRDVHPYDITLTFTGDINLAEGEPTTKELDKNDGDINILDTMSAIFVFSNCTIKPLYSFFPILKV